MKKRFFALGIALAVLLGCLTGLYATTETEGGRGVELTAISENWTYSANSMVYGRDGNGARIDWIMYCPGTGDTGDVLLIKEGSTTGRTIFYANATNHTAQQIVYYHGARLRPVLDYTNSSVSTGHRLIIQLWPK